MFFDRCWCNNFFEILRRVCNTRLRLKKLQAYTLCLNHSAEIESCKVMLSFVFFFPNSSEQIAPTKEIGPYGQFCKIENLQNVAEFLRKLLMFQTDFLRKFWDCSGAKVCKSCRSWKMLSWKISVFHFFLYSLATNFLKINVFRWSMD